MGAVIFLEHAWEANYSLDTWSGNVLNYTKKMEAAGLSWEFLKVPIMVVRTQLFQGPWNPVSRMGQTCEGFDSSEHWNTVQRLQRGFRMCSELSICLGELLTSSVWSSALLTQGRDIPYSLLFSTLPSGKRQLDSTWAVWDIASLKGY